MYWILHTQHKFKYDYFKYSTLQHIVSVVFVKIVYIKIKVKYTPHKYFMTWTTSNLIMRIFYMVY